ncbi:PREDICTED: proteasome subunit beta type-1-like [Drosophila arizonae]|uniref:Proteasome subunit beta type-1-like n=1 Tax=Drosophila arizonae TaxID=7263 RepID=A0ABM1PQL0_DROAR|nr:PREDICTED: proteasome subunit beta type-1-like [Drosophila arizonae]
MDDFYKSFNRSVFGDIDCDSPDKHKPADLVLGSSDNDSNYEMNGGTVMALAGGDFVLLAGDTRLSSDNYILSREQTKLFKMTPTAVFASSGAWCDVIALKSQLEMRIQLYELEHKKTISTESLAHLISMMMYDHRFSPYYTCTILAGLDSKGKGAVYYYDPVGSYERVRYRVVGTSYALLLPCLDVFYGWENNRLTPPLKDEDLTMTMAVRMARNCLFIASDRDIYSGDMGELLSVTSEGMKSSTIKLRAD